MRARILNVLTVLSVGLLVCLFCFIKIVMLHHEQADARSIETVAADTESETESETEKVYDIELIPTETKSQGRHDKEPSLEDEEMLRKMRESETPAETEAETEVVYYAPTDLDLLARVVECEAGSSFVADEHKQLVAKVVLNRVRSANFPGTVYDVIFQGQYTNEPIQYACASRSDFLTLTPSEKSYEIARQVLNGEVTLPDDVIWQAEFPQGETYKTFCYGGTTTYFGR